jgi:low temperature requirement protein LtrA
MLERLRLFMIVALGGTVLTTGTATVAAPSTALHTVAGAAALVVTIFPGAYSSAPRAQLVSRHIEGRTEDPAQASD